MKIYAQHGTQAGDKIAEGFKFGKLDGVIFGAKDISAAALKNELKIIRSKWPEKERLFDPHYYTTVVASEPGARLGYLIGDPGYPYFSARARRELGKEKIIQEDIRVCLGFQETLPVTALIAPNIVIRRSFDSIEGAISKNFIRNAANIAREVANKKKIYVTLAISQDALRDKQELQAFLQEITELENPPDGFYLLLEKPDTTPLPSLTEPGVLARWMLINYTLKINGFHVINGYTDLLAPYIAATGADAVGTGWFNTLKNFSLRRFLPSDSFSRSPILRYTSVKLLKSIRYTELSALCQSFPSLLNNLPSDEYYTNSEEGDYHPTATQEAVQNWEALHKILKVCNADASDVIAALASCRDALFEANELYAAIARSGGTLRERSNNTHITAITDELKEFKELAELS